MLHLGIGRAHARTEIIALIHATDATVITLDGTVLGDYRLDLHRGYQPKQKTAEYELSRFMTLWGQDDTK